MLDCEDPTGTRRVAGDRTVPRWRWCAVAWLAAGWQRNGEPRPAGAAMSVICLAARDRAAAAAAGRGHLRPRGS